MTVRVGNAPVSYGILEAEPANKNLMPWNEVMDAIADAGYDVTELGPYGYFPTDPDTLAAELKKRNLTLASSFVQIPMADKDALEAMIDNVLTVANLLKTQSVGEVILAAPGDDSRLKTAGQQPPGWTDAQWTGVGENLDAIAKRIDEKLGMRVVVHHHAGTYIETPGEVERLLDLVDVKLINLLLDTGHYMYGGGDPAELMEKRGDRITYYHFKDLDSAMLARVKAEKIDYDQACRENIFVPLGCGSGDFEKYVAFLRKTSYPGWLIVESDVIPDEAGRLSPDPIKTVKESRELLAGMGL